MPAKLIFKAEDGAMYPVIFKHGDDLRQDQLILQIISLMDKVRILLCYWGLWFGFSFIWLLNSHWSLWVFVSTINIFSADTMVNFMQLQYCDLWIQQMFLLLYNIEGPTHYILIMKQKLMKLIQTFVFCFWAYSCWEKRIWTWSWHLTKYWPPAQSTVRSCDHSSLFGRK